jgi:hypothetical protein
MKVTIDIPEELHTHYTAFAERHQSTLPTVLKDRLASARDYPFRPIVVTPADRATLEGIACKNLDSGGDLIDLVREASRLNISEAYIDFSMDDLTQMEQYAGFYGESLQECLERITPDFVDYVLSRA